MSRSYAIIGTGALGGFYGARLQRAGLAVHFLLRSDYEYVHTHGLVCESKDGDFTLPQVQAYRTVRDMPRCDVVLVALKATQNHLLPELLPPVLKTDGVVLFLQNGLGGESLVAGIVGAQRVIGGLCSLCSNKVGPGHIRHLDYGQITFGEFDQPGVSDRLRSIADDFTRAGIPVHCHEDLRVARWNKLVWNIPYNGLSVILNATTAELMALPATRQLCQAIMHEVVADARACGVAATDDIITKMIDYTDKMTPYRTSMKVDYEEHRPMEVEAIFGNPLHAALAVGAPSPILETMYRQLLFLDARNSVAQR